ncbi:MAG: hypothetical protein R2752_06840 [Vicinamibacterales bacterium]
MSRMLVTAVGLTVALGASPVPRQDRTLTQADADSMNAKLSFIVETGEVPRPADAPPVQTAFTDREVNAYFRFYGPLFLPKGVQSPVVAIGDRGRLTARAIVDLDAVRTSQERGWLDPLAWVSGKLEVAAAGAVLGANGTGVFQFESATVGGVSVSKGVLQELVRFYTTSPDLPHGFDLDKPFALPAGIRSVGSRRGTATVVQ